MKINFNRDIENRREYLKVSENLIFLDSYSKHLYKIIRTIKNKKRVIYQMLDKLVLNMIYKVGGQVGVTKYAGVRVGVWGFMKNLFKNPVSKMLRFSSILANLFSN